MSLYEMNRGHSDIICIHYRVPIFSIAYSIRLRMNSTIELYSSRYHKVCNEFKKHQLPIVLPEQASDGDERYFIHKFIINT